MKLTHVKLAFAAAAFAAFAAHAGEPAKQPVSRVDVEWRDPTQMTEYQRSRGYAAKRDAVAAVQTLAKHLDKKAEALLPEGQTLSVFLSDVDLAGEYEPWGGFRKDHVRIIRNIYPPRIELAYQLRDAQGAVLREGSAELRDPAFETGGSPSGNESLRYEKRMIDQWLRQEFASTATAKAD